jgi:hypothetical protein
MFDFYRAGFTMGLQQDQAAVTQLARSIAYWQGYLMAVGMRMWLGGPASEDRLR